MVDLTRLQRRGPSGNVRRANLDKAPGARTLNAVGKLGEGLANLSNNLLKERKDQQTREFRDNNHFELVRETQEYRTDNQGLAKSDPDAYLEGFNEFLDNRQSEMAEAAPTDEAKNQFMNKSSAFKAQSLIQADGELAKNARDRNIAIKTNQLNEIGTLIRNNPDPEAADQLVGDMILSLEEDQTFSQAETQALQKQAIATGRESYFDSAISQDSMLALNEARGVLDSDNLLMRTASEGEKSRITSRIESAEKVIKSRVRADLVDQTRTIVAGSNTGVVGEADYSSMIRKINASAGVFKPGEADKLKGQVLTARLMDNVSTTMGLTPPTQREDIGELVEREMSFVSDDLRGKVNKAIVTKKIESALREGDNIAFSDPGRYFNERDPKLRELSVMATTGDPGAYRDYKNKMTGYYEQWGHPRQARSFISPQMETVWGKGISVGMERGDIDSVNEIFEVMQNTIGEDIHSAFVDMRKEIPEDFAVMSEIGDKDSRRNAISNFINAKDIKVLSGFESDEKFSELVEDITDDEFFQAVILQGGQEERGRLNSLAMARSVALQAMNQMAGSVGKDEAIKNARTMYSGNYNLVESDWNDKVYPPKSIGGVIINPDKVKVFMENIREEGFNPTEMFKLDLEKGVSPESMNESVRENGLWVQSVDKKGMELHMRGVGGKLEHLPNKDGQITFVPYTTIQNNAPLDIPSSWDLKKRRTRETIKGLFKR